MTPKCETYDGGQNEGETVGELVTSIFLLLRDRIDEVEGFLREASHDGDDEGWCKSIEAQVVGCSRVGSSRENRNAEDALTRRGCVLKTNGIHPGRLIQYNGKQLLDGGGAFRWSFATLILVSLVQRTQAKTLGAAWPR